MKFINIRPEPIPELSEYPNVLHLPMLKIVPVKVAHYYEKLNILWPRLDKIIFISTNAVKYSAPSIQALWSNRKANLQLFAVGEKTAKNAHETFHVPVQAPTKEYSSEALLALEALTHIEGEHILIIGAAGGRQLLQQVLSERGAFYEELHVYERKGVTSTSPLPDDVLCVICTSGEAMENFFKNYPETRQSKKNQLQLLLPSQRLKQFAIESFGVPPKSIKIIENASNEAIVAYLKKEHL